MISLSRNCVVPSAAVNQVTKFAITDKKFYV